MKIQRLVITYNQYDFEADGVPPKSYGAKVDIVGDQGNLITGLTVLTVHTILDLIAPEVVEQIKAMQKTVTYNSIIAQDNLLEYQSPAPKVIVEDGSEMF